MSKRRNNQQQSRMSGHVFFCCRVAGILYNNAEPLDIFLGPCCEVFKGCCHMAKDFGIGCPEKRADLRKRVVCKSATWNQ